MDAADLCPLKGRFYIPADEVKQLFAEKGISGQQKTYEFLMSLVQPASALARTPISKFNVGAVGLGGSGAIYVGVNIEFPRSHLNNSIHGEQFLLMNCLHHGERSIEVLAVSEAPCGHCRQFYAELSNSETVRFVYGAGQYATQRSASCSGTASTSGQSPHSSYTAYSLDQLLPAKFGPMDLIEDGAPFPLLLEAQNNKVKLSHAAKLDLAAAQQAAASQGMVDAMSQAGQVAEQWAQKSYSPYTHSPSGAAIVTKTGKVYGGCFVESAAFNPSLTPFHVAWIAAVTDHVAGLEEISQVVLAELPDAPVQHAEHIEALLKRLSPAAMVFTVPLERT